MNNKFNLPESVINFSNYLETIKNKSDKTVTAYQSDLGLFFKHLLIQRKQVSSNADFDKINITEIEDCLIQSITLKDLYKFMSYVEKKRENGAYARARKVATLKSYFKYLHKKEKLIKENPAEELEMPKVSRRQPNVLSVQESIGLLKSLDEYEYFYYRDYCILTLFLNCGMRLSELRNIKIEDIRDDVLTIVGKGDKERKIYLNNSCLKAIDNYLEVREDEKCSNEDKKYLFISRLNKVISNRAIELLVRKHFSNAGIDIEKFHTHSMRASYATMLYNEGVDVETLATSMGHSNSSTTRIYLNISEDKLRSVSKINPLNNL